MVPTLGGRNDFQVKHLCVIGVKPRNPVLLNGNLSRLKSNTRKSILRVDTVEEMFDVTFNCLIGSIFDNPTQVRFWDTS